MLNKKIDYFLTLAECLNFTQAAARHSVSQTAISQYIASLEDKLGVRLFNRSSHAVSLTEAGNYYYQQVRFIRKFYEETEKRLHAIDKQYNGYVKVGIGVYEYCNTEKFFGTFLQEHPAVKVDIFQYTYSDLTEKLKTGELDIIIANSICENAFQKEEYTSETLFTCRNYLVADRTLAEKYRDESVTDMLNGEYLITNCEDKGPSSLDVLKNLLMNEFGFVPERIEQTNSIGAQLLLVRSRHGVAIVPDFIKEIYESSFSRFPLSEQCTDRYSLIRLNGNVNPMADLIMDLAAHWQNT